MASKAWESTCRPCLYRAYNQRWGWSYKSACHWLSRPGNWLGFQQNLWPWKLRINTDIFSLLYIQPEIKGGHIKYIHDLGFGNQVIYSSFSEILGMSKRHHNQLCFIFTSLCINNRVEARLISNFKITRRGHKIHPKIFEFHDLNYVTINNNLITLSHLHHKISWFTNNGMNHV